MSTLSILARSVGEQSFKREFADQCIKIGMQLVNSHPEDPDVHYCAYNLFGAIATIMKEDMQPVLQECVTIMLKTIQSLDGNKLFHY